MRQKCSYKIFRIIFLQLSCGKVVIAIRPLTMTANLFKQETIQINGEPFKSCLLIGPNCKTSLIMLIISGLVISWLSLLFALTSVGNFDRFCIRKTLFSLSLLCPQELLDPRIHCTYFKRGFWDFLIYFAYVMRRDNS